MEENELMKRKIKRLLEILRYRPRWLCDNFENKYPESQTMEAVKNVWEDNPWKYNRMKRYWEDPILGRQELSILSENELLARIAVIFEEEEKGIHVTRLELPARIRCDIYMGKEKVVSLRYVKDTDTLDYIFYQKVYFLSEPLSIGSFMRCCQSRINNNRLSREEEFDYLVRTKGKLSKDNIWFKFYKRDRPMEPKGGTENKEG